MSKPDIENSMFVSDRTAKMGGFLILDDELNSYSLDNPVVQETLATLKKPYRETVTAILQNALNALDPQCSIGYNELPDLTAIPLRRLNVHIRELREVGVIVSVPFKFSDGTFHPKVKAERLNLTSGANSPAIVTEEKAGTRLVSKRWYREQALQERSIQPMDKRVDSSNLPHVVRPRGEFIVDQLVSPNSRPRGPLARIKSEQMQQYEEQSRSFVVNTDDGPKSFLAQIRSFSNVMDASDLQVQYAIYSLIFNYHSYFSQKNGTKPTNLTPVYVDDIVLMIGRKLGGKNRNYVRDCIQIIEDTEFNLLSLERMNIKLTESQLSGFARDKYKNFKTCIPVTETPPKRDPKTDRVVLAKDAMVYLIALPDQIFENLIQNETVFAFPPESLSMPALMFAMYLRFRALVRNHRHSESLRGLKQKLQYTVPPTGKGAKQDDFVVFKNALRNELERISKKPQDHLYAKFEGNRVLFNSFGYHGEIDFDTDQYFVVCHQQEMLACCRLDVNPNSRAIEESAPVVYNGMSAMYPDRIHKRLNIAINKIVTSEQFMFHMRYTSEQYRGEVIVHKYASQNETLAAARELSLMGKTAFDIHVLEQKIERDLDLLVGLKLGKYSVTKNDMNHLWEHEKLMAYVEDIDVIKLLQKVNRTRRIHSDLKVFFEGEAMSASLERFFDLFIESEFPEEEF